MWIKAIHAYSFLHEIQQIMLKKTKERIPKAHKYLTQFGLYVDEKETFVVTGELVIVCCHRTV